MKVLGVLLLTACGGGVPIQIPDEAVLDFVVDKEDRRPPIDCTGRLEMAVRTAQFTCTDARQDPAAVSTVSATVDYIQRPDEAWVHLLALDNEKSFYPTYNGIVMAFSLKPNSEGNGWTGSAVYYPKNAIFGFADFRVAAHNH